MSFRQWQVEDVDLIGLKAAGVGGYGCLDGGQMCSVVALYRQIHQLLPLLSPHPTGWVPTMHSPSGFYIPDCTHLREVGHHELTKGISPS
jgi:hypothetical protein